MRFEWEKIGNVLVAKVLDERIAANTAPQFRAELREEIRQGNRTVVVDLAAVTLIDSSGLGALVGTLKAMGEDGDLVVSGARAAVGGMFQLTRMDQVFRMYENAGDAVAALS